MGVSVGEKIVAFRGGVNIEQEITKDWYGHTQESLIEWRDICESCIRQNIRANIAAYYWEYVTAALEHPREHAPTPDHNAENYHERTMSAGAFQMRKRLFGA